MEKLSSSLAVLAENYRKRLKFRISPLRKFENGNLLAEDFSLFPCLPWLIKSTLSNSCKLCYSAQSSDLSCLKDLGKI